MGARRDATSPVGNRLAAHRLAAGLSQWDLADAAGVSRETISNTENNVSLPKVDIALRLAHALGVQVEDLFQLGATEVAGVQASANAVRVRGRRSSTGDQLDRIEHMLTKLLNQLEE